MKSLLRSAVCLRVIKLLSIFGLLQLFLGFPIHSYGQTNSGSNSQGNSMDLIWPTADVRLGNKSVQSIRETYVNRVGAVNLNTNLLLPQSAETGQRAASKASFHSNQMNLSFFPGQNIQVIVDAEERPDNGILLIRGRLVDETISTFTLTITPQSYLVNLQVLDTATQYNIVGDTETGVGQVQEIDMRKIPPRIQ